MNDLPEAPASATLSVITPKGYNTLFTLRETTGIALLDKLALLEVKLESLGYKPQPTRTFGLKKELEYVEGKICPKDGGRLIKKLTKAGKPFHKCENGKWNPVTNRNEGCDFIDWLNMPTTHDPKEPYKNGGVSVEDYENYQP